MEQAKSIPGVKEISFVKNIGDKVGNIESSVDRIGFVIAQGKDADEAEFICNEAISLINIEVENN